MGKEFTAILPDGTERFAAGFANRRAQLFYDIALLLERYVNLPCGISPDTGEDEHLIDPAQFIPFFERVWKEGWPTDIRGGFLTGWAAYAAGMIENITLEKRTWVDRDGATLSPQRQMRPEEICVDKQAGDT